MPSYIEFDKTVSFPSSSNVSKIIFGINDVGQAITIDHSGNVLPLSQSNFVSASYAVTASYALNGGGGGGGGSPTPCANDYVQMYGYTNWFRGTSAFGTSGTVDKFTGLAENNDPGDYLTLELVWGQVQGVGISTCPSYSITITPGDVTYRDDGYGTYATNYIDFLNGVFASHSLYTTFTGSSGYIRAYDLLTSYCKTDNFSFLFKETGTLTPNNISSPFYYYFETGRGAIRDCVGSDVRGVNNSSTVSWYFL